MEMTCYEGQANFTRSDQSQIPGTETGVSVTGTETGVSETATQTGVSDTGTQTGTAVINLFSHYLHYFSHYF